MHIPLSVLFVDDENGVLEGIQRLLRSYRKKWDMEFISSVSIALERIQSKSFDVVVSDMRMPSMDGATFLKQVQRFSPQTRRIILSGQSDQDSLIRSAVICHQYLAKPCTSEKLREAILRGNTMLEMYDVYELRKRLVGCTCVASPSQCARNFRELFVEKPLPSLDDLENAVLDDIGIFAKIVQVFGSSVFGTANHHKDIRQILTEIGIENLRRIVSHDGVVWETGSSAEDARLRVLNSYSKRIAARARSIMIELEPTNTSLHFLAYASGMLHSIGQCAMWGQVQELNVLNASVAPTSLQHQSFLSENRACVAYTSSFLLDVWGLPPKIVKAVADSGLPIDALDSNEIVSVSLALSLLLENIPQHSNPNLLPVNVCKDHSTLYEFTKQVCDQTQRKTVKSI